MNEYINLDLENIESEHICCAIGDKKHQGGVNLKKEWIKNDLSKGHVFRKLKEQGKIFIEYAPLENAWVPVSGENFLYIYCLWVAGCFKGKGYGKELLEYAIEDAKKQNKNGICTLTSKKKKPYLSEKKFFERYGFKVVDSIGEFELLALCFNDKEPRFNETARKMEIESKDLTIFYTEQCPYTNNCIKETNEYKEETGAVINIEKIDTLEKAKNVPCVFNGWANFKDGKYVSNLLLNKNMVKKMFE
ncbi:MAG: GNAT family N-acetyltransferase [Clostridia bacterium]|nr:GNAT family N-acetyltransferase [Clostridia bacterium]